ncbi:Methionine import ATP-binding protein MetN [Dermatophilus congolensis]|uniref:Methionine import ATP-binding protein MetN n=1 Tax=Dermatophilus congolensis TaxID=1863 RepID=A0AA46BPN4_9MICO|nr:methionine ABC transporter ATP-binding protein [Dermatophilus congolensis]STD13692.1 Methionine import ATP-binding protein MetN [Dermatophilus congolensis]
MIEIDSVTKVYPGRGGSAEVTAVDDVTLTIDSGQIFGILGRSGAGKTTLLRCLNFLEHPTSGRISIDGVNFTSLKPAELRAKRQSIGTVFQHFNLLHARTAAENISYPMEISGVPAAERSTRVAELLELVGLADRGSNYPSQLSGGQKQRVGIARALAGNPSVLLCDEATSALDPHTTEQILDLIKDINARTGVTVVMITHEAEVVRRICDAAAFMEGGRVVETGQLLDLIANPASRLAEMLLPTGQPDVADQGRALVLGFANENAVEPMIADLARETGIELAILSGTVERVAGRRVGRLMVTVPGTSADDVAAAQSAVATYFEARGVSVTPR